jgi:autotransporter-associated beta strand protein
MFRTLRLDRTALAVAALAVLAAGPARAADNVWTGAANNLTWSTSAANWSLSPNTWANQFTDSAFFNGAKTGTIAVGTPISLRGMSFNANGYVISGSGSNVLTLTAGFGGSLQDGEIQVANGVTATVNDFLAGSVGLAKTGAGTLLLGSLNMYTGGTNINAGTLAVTASGAVLPAGGNVTVASGATFNYGNGAIITNSGTAIGTLTLNNGTYRVSGDFGEFYLNQLVTGSGGGTVDLGGGTSDVLTHLTGSGAGITVNGNSTWTGGGTSDIQNDTNATIDIAINNYSTLTNGIKLARGFGGKGFRLTGTPNTVSTMVLTNLGSTADLTADSTGYLEVNNMANLGSGTITLQNTGSDFRPGTIRYDGGNTLSARAITLGAHGSQPFSGQLYVNAPGANLTLTGVIGETPAAGAGLLVTANGQGGPTSTLTLAGANTYTGPTTIAFGGTLSVATIPNGGVAGPLGMSSSAPANLVIGHPDYAGGTLQYTGPDATTDRGITLAAFRDSSFTNVNSVQVTTPATTLAVTGQVTGSGALTVPGPGRLALTNATNNYAGGTIINGTVSNIAYLMVPDPAALGTGGITLNHGALVYTGAGAAATSKAIILGGGIGYLGITSPGASLTLSGTISESAAGQFFNPFNYPQTTVTLTGSNTFTGEIALSNGGTLSVPSVANGGLPSPLGASSSAPGNVVLNAGTLQYTGPNATTDRGLTTFTGTVEVANAGTNLTVAGQVIGLGGLTKAGPGTLTLANASTLSPNNYTGGTFVNAGRLQVGDNTGGAALPAGGNVTVAAGAELNTGVELVVPSSGIGTLTLNGGALRGTGTNGTAVFYLNSLVVGAAGGAVEFTGNSSMVFRGGGAGITVNGNSTWTGSNSSYLVASVASGAPDPLPITIAPNVTLGSNLTFAATAPTGFQVTGGGTLYLTTTNAAPVGSPYLIVGPGTTLRVDDVTTNGNGALGNGPLTLNGGTLRYSGSSNSTTNKPIALANGGTVQVDGTANLTSAGQLTGTGGLTKTGPGTLTLTNTTNNYTGGTFVNAGVLALASVDRVLPPGSYVTVAAGAEFDAGFPGGNSGNSIGTLALNGGTLRLANNFGLNKLTTDGTGGTVTAAAASSYALFFSNAGASITVNGNSTWAGSNSAVVNFTGAPITITVANYSTLTVNASLTTGFGPGFLLTGTPNTVSTMVLTNPGSTADLTADSTGYLEVADMAYLGSGKLTLQNTNNDIRPGTIRYDGTGTATSAKPITLGTGGGQIYVNAAGTTLTLSGVIDESPPGGHQPLLVTANGQGGPTSILALTGANTYTGPTTIAFGGTLSVASIPTAGAAGGNAGPLGASSNSPANLVIGHPGYGGGTLQYTGYTAVTGGEVTTDRGVTLVAYQNTSFTNVNAIEVTNALTNLTFTGQFTGTGGLTKTGSGTLTLTNTADNYAGGTFVNAGRLVVGGTNGAGVIPAGTNVTVAAGAEFNVAAPIAVDTSIALGTVTLNGGTLRLSGNAVRHFLNQLVTGTAGGTVDLTPPGSTPPRLDFTNPGAAITVNGNSTWTGTGSWFINVSGAELPVTVAPAVTLANGIDLVSSTAADRFRVTGGGTLYQTSVSSGFGAYVAVNQARLRLDGVAPLANWDLTLDGGTLQYTGSNATLNNNGFTSRAFTLNAGGGTVEVSAAGTTLTVSGSVTGAGGLTKTGPGTLLLNNPANNYAGGTTVTAGVLGVNNDAELGPGAVTVNPAGTLRYTANASTGRTFNLNGGTLEAPAGVTLTFNGAAVNGGYLTGGFATQAGSSNSFAGGNFVPSTTLTLNGNDSLVNYNQGGQLTINPGSSSSLTRTTNTTSGRITVGSGASVSVSDFQSIGRIDVTGTGVLTNTGPSAMYFGGGSLTTIGGYNPTTGQVTPGGSLNLGNQTLFLTGAFLRNNGSIDSTGPNAKLVIDAGATVKGGGDINVHYEQRNGGLLFTGNSPGLSRQVFASLSGGQTQVADFSNATGTAGPPVGSSGTQLSGWGVIEYGQTAANVATNPGFLQITSTPSTKAIFKFTTVQDGGTYSTPGAPANFNPLQSYTWTIFRPRSAADVNNPTNVTPVNATPPLEPIQIIDAMTSQVFSQANNNLTVATLNQYLTFDSSAFFAAPGVLASTTGTFAFTLLPDALSNPNRVVAVTFSPVPEPAAALLVGLTALAAGWRLRRGRRDRSLRSRRNETYFLRT